MNYYAYLNNPAFVSTAAYQFGDPQGYNELNTIEQYYAGIGWNLLGSITAKNYFNIYQVFYTDPF